MITEERVSKILKISSIVYIVGIVLLYFWFSYVVNSSSNRVTPISLIPLPFMAASMFLLRRLIIKGELINKSSGLIIGLLLLLPVLGVHSIFFISFVNYHPVLTPFLR